MKKTILALTLLVAAASLSRADQVVCDTNFISFPALAYSTAPVLDLAHGLQSPGANAQCAGVDFLSVQATASSATIPTSVFTDGAASTDTITVISTQGIVGIQATNLITVNTNSALSAQMSTDTVVILTTTGLAGQTLKLNGYTLTANTDFQVASSTAQTAINLAKAITNLPNFTATANSSINGSTVTITYDAAGIAGNLIGVVSSTPTAMAVATSSMTIGQDNAFITFNSQRFTQGTDWFQADKSSNTAISLASALNGQQGIIASTNTTTTVLLQCPSTGTVCNSYTLTSSTPSALTVSSATFAPGQNPAVLIINGVVLTAGSPQSPTVFQVGATTITTAVNISSCILNNSTLKTLIVSTDNARGVVSATTTAVGLNTTYAVFSSTPAAVKFGNPQFFGGADANFTIGTGVIAISTNSFTLALPVLYTTNTAVGLSPLVPQTTYYVVPISTTTGGIELATSSGNALSGVYITLTSSSTSGPHKFTLAPLAYTGTPSYKWQNSNDGTNFADVPVISSATILTPTLGGATTFWDLQEPQYHYLRLNIIGPTTGGLNLVVRAFGKQRYSK